MHTKPVSPPPWMRSQIDRLGPPTRGRRFPPELRGRIATWARAQRATHAAEEVSSALGIPWQTISRWLADVGAGSAPMFKTVEVAAEVPAGLVVHGPCGLRIEVRDVNALAALLRSLE